MVSNTSSSLAVTAVLLLFSLFQGEAFSPAARPSQFQLVTTTQQQRSSLIGRVTPLLQMSTDDDEVMGLPPLPSDAGKAVVVPQQQQSAPPAAVVSTTSNNNNAVEKEDELLQSYPIDLPSPILLATSMVLAISSIGSLFELSGGTPKLGFAVTAVITALGLPLSVFLIYAAILKGAAETEEADREFNKPRRL